MFKKEVDPRKKFKEKYNFKRHIKSIHEGKRPHKCDHCDHLSKSNSDLKSHINDIHKEEKRHQCKDWGKSFAQMDP